MLTKPYSDPEGFALTAFSAEYDLAGEFFNEDEIINALHSRYDYTMQRINWEPTCNLGFNHMELGSLITFFCENMIGTWRSAAFSNARGLHAPGLSKELIDYLMSIKLPNRYIKILSLDNFLPGRDYGNRYALKKLLKKRLPSYQTNARKFGSRLPLLEYISGDGPLADIFSRYKKPDFIEGMYRNALDKPTSKSAYFYFSSLTYSIWHDELIETDKIDPAGKAKIFSLQIE